MITRLAFAHCSAIGSQWSLTSADWPLTVSDSPLKWRLRTCMALRDTPWIREATYASIVPTNTWCWSIFSRPKKNFIELPKLIGTAKEGKQPKFVANLCLLSCDLHYQLHHRLRLRYAPSVNCYSSPTVRLLSVISRRHTLLNSGQHLHYETGCDKLSCLLKASVNKHKTSLNMKCHTKTQN